MRIQTKHSHHRSLLLIIDHIVRRQRGVIHVPDLAEFVGFSRFHLSRFFRASTGETPSDFVRRIRLERAAYRLMTSTAVMTEISDEAGYTSPEAFSRAFRRAYGIPPSHFRGSGRDWVLYSPADLHWSGSKAAEWPIRCGDFPLNMVGRQTVKIVCQRVTGDYKDIGKAWQALYEAHAGKAAPGTRWYSVFHDHPENIDKSELRADIGFSVMDESQVPPGMQSLSLPGGVYVATRSASDAQGRTAAWTYLEENWIPVRGQRPKNVPTFEEYEAWPVPYQAVPGRCFVGLEIDLGSPS